MSKRKKLNERDRGPGDPAPSPVPGPIDPKPRPSPKKPGKAVALRLRPRPRPLSMLMLIDRYARDPAVDPAKYRALLEIQEGVARKAAEAEFTRDFNRLIPKLPHVTNDGLIVIDPKPGKRGQKTPYASLDNIKRALWPLLADHHFGFQWYSEVIPAGEHGQLQHVCHGRLTHDNGVFRESSWPIYPETTGSKNEAQARGSGSSYAKRYTLRDLVPFISFAKEDRDDDAASAIEEGTLVSKEQAKTLRKAIKDCGVSPEAFEQHFGPPEKLPLARYDEAIARCKQFGERMTGGTKDAAA